MSQLKNYIANIQEQVQNSTEGSDLSIRELERKAGLKRGAIQNILDGKSSNPGIESLTAIADMIGCSLDDLVGRSEAKKLKLEQEFIKAKPKEIVTLDMDLYQNCLKAVENYLESKKLYPNGEQILFFVKEVYLYAQKSQSDKPDQKFITWLIDNYC